MIRTMVRMAALAAAVVLAVAGRAGEARAATGTGNALYLNQSYCYINNWVTPAWTIPSGATHLHLKASIGAQWIGTTEVLVNGAWQALKTGSGVAWDAFAPLPAGATHVRNSLYKYTGWGWCNGSWIDVPEYAVLPQPVASFYVSATTDTSITLGWTNNADNGIGSYDRFELYDGGTKLTTTTATSYTHAVTPGTVHTYKIRVTDANGTGFSTYASLTAHPTPKAPGTPTALGKTATSIDVSWSAGGNPAEVRYRLCESLRLRRCWDAGTNTHYNVTGLSVDTAYTFTAEAYRSDGGTVASSPATIRTHANPPSNLRVGAAGADRLDASWETNGNPSSTQYYASIARVSDGVTIAASGWMQRSWYTFTGLATNTAYTVTVQTSNPTAVRATKYTLAVAPTMTAVTVDSPNRLTVSWGAGGNPSGTTYEVLRDARVNRYGAVSGGTVVYTGTATSYANTGLGANTYHTYMVRAKNGDGVLSGYSEQRGAWTLAQVPGTPTSPDAFSNGVQVAWNRNGNPGSTTYVLERSLDQSAWTEVWRGTSPAAVDTGLADALRHNADGVPSASGKRFHYRVYALNGAGVATTPSNAGSATLAALKDAVAVGVNVKGNQGAPGSGFRKYAEWGVPHGGILKRLDVHFDFSVGTNRYTAERIAIYGFTPDGVKKTLWDGDNMYGFPAAWPGPRDYCGTPDGYWSADLQLNPDAIPDGIVRVEVWGEGKSTLTCDYLQTGEVTLRNAVIAVGYPNAAALLLDNGAPETSKHDITVGAVADKNTYAAPRGLDGTAPDTLQLSNDGVNWSSQPFAVPVSWRLGAEYGEKAVWVKLCRGGYCLSSPFRRTIRVVGALPPPRLTLAINDGAAWSPGRTVTLRATAALDGNPASYGPWRLSFSNLSAEGPWSTPETMAGLVATREWDLCEGLAPAACAQNPRTVYARLTDALGHEVVAAAAVSWGDAAPVAVTTAAGTAATVSLNGQSVPVRVVNSPRVPLTLSAPAGSRWRVSFDGGATFGQWSPVSAAAALTLPRTDGPVAAAVEFRLPDGTTSDIRVLDFLLDTQAPTLQASWLGNASVTANGSATLVLNAQDNLSPRSALQVSLDGGATWQAYSTTRTVTFTGSGYKTLTVLVRDQAGNLASAILGIYN